MTDHSDIPAREPARELTGLEIAVVGLACRFPGARNADEFWRNLAGGVESVTFFTDEELAAAGVPLEVRRHPDFVPAGAVVDDLDRFDAGYFGLSPREAEIIDPQQRMFLECAVEALESAGCDPDRFDAGIGVWGGVGVNSYLLFNLLGNPELVRLAGRQQLDYANRGDTLTTRTAYKLNLRGPAVTVQTTCSTSLVAVHLASQSLLAGECDLALAGGVAADVGQRQGYLYREGGILSPDGHCRAFDAQAGGMISGNGCGVVVLRRLADALAARDRILAVIRGSAINNDGSLKASYTAPSVEGQARVVRAAQIVADVEPETLGYVEAHGTGTHLGDPVEVAALTRAFRAATDRRGFCALGSVKTNIGHLDVAAGVAGFIKAVLALHHRQIPPSLNFTSPHPTIDFAASPFYVNTALSDWPAVSGAPRRAGVSSLGIGGTNAHVILEEAPPEAVSGPSRPRLPLLLSAKTPSALDAATVRLAAHFRLHPDLSLADAAYTLAVGRRALDHRRFVVAADVADAAAVLAGEEPRRLATGEHDGGERSVVFLFPGQGSQYPGMGAELYRSEPVYRAEVDRCAEILRPHLGRDLRELLMPAAGREEQAAEELRQTRFAQPALFTVEYALARLWMDWGIRPRAMLGHSLGEYVAACLAGVFPLADALSLVAARGRMMQALPPGSMLSVPLPESEVIPLLGDGLALAAVNGPALTVVSGTEEAVAALAARLAERGLEGRRLHTSHAFHSGMMEPILEPFAERVSRVPLSPPEIPFLSNLTGTWITKGQATDPHYWARQLRSAVRFADAVRELLAEPGRVFLEVGPGRTLSGFARLQKTGDGAPPAAVTSLRHALDEGSDQETVLTALGRLWLAGVEVDWPAFWSREDRRKIQLPSYPFERERYWIEPRQRLEAAVGPALEAPGTPAAAGLQLHGRPRVSTLYVAPRTDRERAMAGIWEQLLGISGLGVHDDFFELGGHSLLATQLLSRIRDNFRVELPLKALFDAPSVAELTAVVEADAAVGAEPVEPPLVPVPRDERMRLSFAQQRLWFLHSFEPESDAYNMPLAVRLSGRLRDGALERTLTEIVRRHEVLRTVFPETDGEPVQVVMPAGPMPVRRIDLSGLPAAEREGKMREIVTAEARRTFDLARGPLVRAALVRLEEREHVAVLTMHHIVTDGWSMGILVRELCALYRAFALGEPSPLPELPLQYADFAQWQRSYLDGPVLERKLDYWRQAIGLNPPALELPTDRPRTRERAWGGAVQRFAVRPDLAADLYRLGQQRNATLFMTLLTAFEILLYRYSGQDTLLVGTPIANRNRSEIEDLIGFFVNTLVLRTDVGGAPTAEEFLAQVRAASLAAHAHQDVPFERLVEELQSERDLSRSPLFQAFFVLQNTPVSAAELPELTLSLLEEDTGSAKFDLSLQMEEGSSGLVGLLEYSTDLFEAATVARLAAHYLRLLEAVAEDPSVRLGDLPLLSAAERQQLLAEWNDTAVDYGSDALLHELFARQAERMPEAVAVICEGERTSYGELAGRVEALARRLLASGLAPEEPVGLCLERSLEMVVAILGVLTAGGAYVPLDPGYPRERLEYMVADAGAGLVLTQRRLAGLLPESGARVLCLDEDLGAEVAIPLPAGHPEQLAYVIYTSGSTGRPKGAMNTHRAVRNRILWMQAAYGLGPEDRVLQKTPFSFDVSVWEFLWPLLTGAALVVARPGGHLDPGYLVELIERERVSTLHFVPPMLQVFLERDDLARCGSVRRVMASGEALPAELERRFFRSPLRGAGLYNLYGPTEAAVDVTAWECRAESGRDNVPIGRPIGNLRIVVLDRWQRPAPVGVPGELHIGGVGLARGYWRRPELTAERFVPDGTGEEPGARLYRTGDLVRARPAGEIEYLGRLDHQVKIRGFRIELGEIEAALAHHPGVREAVVLARAEGGDRRLVAYVVPAEGELQVSELRDFLQRTLPEHMVPQAFVSLPELPLSPNGKVDRRALPAPDGASPTREYVPPRNETEEKLAAIFTEVLGVERIGVHDSFFEIGGHSLKAMQVVSRVRRAFGVEVPLRRLFQTPTVAGLAGAIGDSLAQVREKERIDAVLSRLAGLSEDEARALLAEKLRAKTRAGKGGAR